MAKTAAGRAKKIADLVAMLARGETVIPMKAARAKSAAPPEGTTRPPGKTRKTAPRPRRR